MRFFVFSCILSLCLLSCRKQDQPHDFTGILVSKKFTIVSSPKMYTKFGEVTDKKLISRYVANLKIDQLFYLNLDTTINPLGDTIKFISPDTALIKAFFRWEKKVVKPEGNYLFLYPRDTIRYESRPSSNPFNEAVNNIGIHKPSIKITCPFNNTTRCRFDVYEANIARWESDKLVLPLMSYRFSHVEPDRISYGISRYSYNNVFDPSVMNFLKERDTLIVQAFELAFDKVK